MNVRRFFAPASPSVTEEISNADASRAEELLVRRAAQAMVDFPDQAPVFEAVSCTALDEEGMRRARYEIGALSIRETIQQLAQKI